MNGLDKWFETKFAATVYDRLLKSGLKLAGKETKEQVIDIINDIAKYKSKEAVKKSIEIAYDTAKGDETQEELGTAAATEFAKSNRADLEEQIMARLQKH